MFKQIQLKLLLSKQKCSFRWIKIFQYIFTRTTYFFLETKSSNQGSNPDNFASSLRKADECMRTFFPIINRSRMANESARM